MHEKPRLIPILIHSLELQLFVPKEAIFFTSFAFSAHLLKRPLLREHFFSFQRRSLFNNGDSKNFAELRSFKSISCPFKC